MQPSRSFATDRKPRTMIMPPGSLSGRNFQPSFHSGMEAAYVGHRANPFQNRPARSSGREIDVKAPVRRRCCMPQDVGIRPLDEAETTLIQGASGCRSAPLTVSLAVAHDAGSRSMPPMQARAASMT